MANKPLPNLLPADMPENWQTNQIVAPVGADVGLAEQYGYNYLMAQLNAAQQAINNINDAFPELASLIGGKIPLAQLPIDTALSNTSGNPVQNKVVYAALADKVPTGRKVNGKALTGDISLTAADVGARPSTWTPTAANVGAVPTSRKVNNKALSADISLTAADVGALASNGKAATAGTADTAKACSGNAATATKLATARSISVNVGSNIGSNFDGSANITPGVYGVLPVANGGTGANSAAGARTALGITNVYIASGTFTQDTFTSYTITIGFLAKLFIVVYKTKYNSAETLALWNVPIINPTSGAYVCNLYNTTDGEHTVTFNTNNIVFNKLSRGTYLWLAIG